MNISLLVHLSVSYLLIPVIFLLDVLIMALTQQPFFLMGILFYITILESKLLSLQVITGIAYLVELFILGSNPSLDLMVSVPLIITLLYIKGITHQHKITNLLLTWLCLLLQYSVIFGFQTSLSFVSLTNIIIYLIIVLLIRKMLR